MAFLTHCCQIWAYYRMQLTMQLMHKTSNRVNQTLDLESLGYIKEAYRYLDHQK